MQAAPPVEMCERGRCREVTNIGKEQRSIFAGLDMALEETAIWVVDETGQIMNEAGAASAPEARDALLSNLRVPRERLGLEACSLTAWLHGELKATAGRSALNCARRRWR
jgi:hypothetical protein